MTSDMHLTDTSHCLERVFTTPNSTPNERKISTENMTAKGTRNSTLNMLVNIQPICYTCLTKSKHPFSCITVA